MITAQTESQIKLFEEVEGNVIYLTYSKSAQQTVRVISSENFESKNKIDQIYSNRQMIIFEDGTNISLKENERIIDVVGDNYLSELDNSTTDNKIISNYQLIENKFELVSSKQSSSIVSYNFLSNGNIIYSDLFETYGSTIVMSNFKFEKLYSFSAPQGFTSFVYTELSNLAILLLMKI